MAFASPGVFVAPGERGEAGRVTDGDARPLPRDHSALLELGERARDELANGAEPRGELRLREGELDGGVRLDWCRRRLRLRCPHGTLARRITLRRSPLRRRGLRASPGPLALLGQGVAAARIVVAGDSAGGGLTVATLVSLRDRGLPRPAGGVCISPWVDLTNSAASYETKAAVDPIVTHDGIRQMTEAYIGAGDPKQPLASPLYADLRGLPPLLVHVGSDEVLLDDAVALGHRARDAGVDAIVEEWPAMIHVWHWFLPMLDEASRAISDIGRFVRARIA